MVQRERDDDETEAAYSHRLDVLEGVFDTRVALWREERQNLSTALSEAKLRLEKTQEEIRSIEQSLTLVSKHETDLDLDCQVEQERVLNEYDRASSAIASKRQDADLKASFVLIRDLARDYEPCTPRTYANSL